MTLSKSYQPNFHLLHFLIVHFSSQYKSCNNTFFNSITENYMSTGGSSRPTSYEAELSATCKAETAH